MTTTTTKNGGEWIYRLDPWVHRATFAKQHALYEGHFWEDNYQFKNPRPKKILPQVVLKFMKLM